MDSNDFTTPERIIAEVAMNVNDEQMRTGFSMGWYMSQVQKALTELAFETKYFKVVHDQELPSDLLQIEIPKNVFDVREIYLYNGTLCNPNKTQVVHWKRLFNNSGNGPGYTARVKDDGSNSGDLFIPNQDNTTHNFRPYTGKKFYCNVVNGTMMFSEDCKAFPYVRIVFNGMGVEIGEKPIIPRMFERAIIDFIEERYYNAMKARDPRVYRSLWNDAYARLESYTGSWAKARKRAKAMNQQEKASYDEYISSMLHK